MFEGVIYFSGPKTRWSRRIDDEEVIARITSRFRWLAYWMTRSSYANLDPMRCGYAITKDGVTLDHVEAGE